MIPQHAFDEDQDLEEPIAVCGIALKFPQDASNENEFWKMVVEKRTARTEFPQDRLNIGAFHNSSQRNAIRTRGAHFIREDLGLFDAGFFSITPSEAAAMDPMQRILLETTFHALESAGLRLEDLAGSQCSVHNGCFSNDYLQLLLKDSDQMPPYAAVGASQSMLANRISWFFDLRGPSVNLDSACSSSAMSVDLSCELLRSGKTNVGIVSGSNLLLDPDYTIILSNMQMLSPDGRCYSFDNRANGYSRGEGVAVVVLKRLSDALRDNDTIRALIRATGTNQDGKTPSITQPSSSAQSQLIQDTYNRAGLSLRHTRFFEAHGTGTAIGDPIELGAIAECFQKHSTSSDPLYIGSVKTNIGHLEGASGIAGFIKAVLAVESGIIPPNANFESINRRLACYESFMSFPSDPTPWPHSKTGIRRTSVNSFGYGGTNCHIVVDDALSYLTRKGLLGNHNTVISAQVNRSAAFNKHVHSNNGHMVVSDQQITSSKDDLLSPSKLRIPQLLVWSSSTDKSTRATVDAWSKYLSKENFDWGPSLVSDAAYTLDSRRSLLPFRSFSVVSNTEDLPALTQLMSKPVEAPKQKPHLAYIFTGQGAQWHAMGRELFIYPAFEESVRASQSVIDAFGCCWSAKDELFKSKTETLIDTPAFAQCLTTILQIALIDLLASLDVTPIAVVGHSMGEIAAAYAARFLTRESALRLAYYRGVLTATIPLRSSYTGAMLAVGLPAEQLTQYLCQKGLDGRSTGSSVVISCINSPQNTTLSGDSRLIEEIRFTLDEDRIFNRRLAVPVAYHSPQMELIASVCLEHFGTLQSPPDISSTPIKMVSSVTGGLLSRKRACQGSYWVANMVSPVLFSEAISRLCRDQVKPITKKLDRSHLANFAVDTLVEVGPHAALRLPITQILEKSVRKKEISYFSSLVRNNSACTTFLQLLGSLHCRGLEINLRGINDPHRTSKHSRTHLVHAPKYCFDHSNRYWAESSLVRNYRMRKNGQVELLGAPSRDWNPLEPQWRCCIQPADIPWLTEHKLNGRSVYPASAMIVMAIEGVSQLLGTDNVVTGYTLHNVRYDAPIVVSSNSRDLETRLKLRPIQNTRHSTSFSWDFVVYSTASGRWSANCRGMIRAHIHSSSDLEEEHQRSTIYDQCIQERDRNCTLSFDSTSVYDNFAKHGFQYGPSFQGITTMRHDHINTVTAGLSLQKPINKSPGSNAFTIHPASLDSFLHIALMALSKKDLSIPTQAITDIKMLWVSAQGLAPSEKILQVSAKLESETRMTKRYSGFALSNAAQLRLAVDGLETTVISSRNQLQTTTGQPQYYYTIHSAPDIDVLTSAEVLEWLDKSCGIDTIGPKDFFRDLRAYLHYKVDMLLAQTKAIAIDPSKAHFSRYVDWMLWHLANKLPDCHATNEKEFRSRIESQGFLGDFFLKVADNALDVLQGKKDMVQLLFEDSLVNRFYEQQLSDSLYYRKLRTYLEALSFKHPDMDFLEVGAGTGSFTKHIMHAVSSGPGADSRFSSYCFTDISAAFFQGARQQFATAAHKMNFAILDIGEDPLAQGFKEHSYDVISASNVLHITSDLGQTLQRIRKLLKPNGQLFLHEYVRPERIEVGFVFGLLPGWWPTDKSGRTMSPLCSEDAWDKKLRESGFSGADFILRDFVDDESHLMSIICATATGEPDRQEPFFPSVTIAVEADSTPQHHMAVELAEKVKAKGSPRVAIIELSEPLEGSIEGALITLFDLESAILSRMNETQFESIKSLLSSASKVIWISKGGNGNVDPSHGMIDGFAKVFRTENIDSKLATLALDPHDYSQTNQLNHICLALGRLAQSEGLNQSEDYFVDDGVLNLRRIVENKSFQVTINDTLASQSHVTKRIKDAGPFKVLLEVSSELPSLRIYQEESTDGVLEPDEVEIEVDTVSLNHLDSSVMMGYNSNLNVGRECAGTVIRAGAQSQFFQGDRVCAYGLDMFRSASRTKHQLVARIPASLSFQVAATLPQDYIVANYLVNEARIRQDDIVLVRGGHSRLCRATLRLLEQMKTNVMATAPTKADVESLQLLFPGLYLCTDDSISESLHLRFASEASIAFDFRDTLPFQLFEAVAKFGQVFLVKSGTSNHSAQVNCLETPPTIGFRLVDVALVLQHRLPQLHMPRVPFTLSSDQQLSPKITKTLSSLETLPVQCRDIDIEERVVVTYDCEERIPIYQRCASKQIFDVGSSYVIVGGFGDLGKCIATWMVQRGARNLIILSRSGQDSRAARSTIEELENLGARICAPACDVADQVSLSRSLQSCHDMPPIKGCVQAAGALKDTMYQKMRYNDWKVAVDPKARGSWNLHKLLPKGMDFFILASSISGIVGQATQINYATGNSYQDALAKYRLSMREKAVSLDLGILLTGGLLSQNKKLSERLEAEGTYVPLSEVEILALFEHFCDPSLEVDRLPSQVVSGIKKPLLLTERARSSTVAFNHPFWSHTLVRSDTDTNGTSENSDAADVIRAGPSLAGASSLEEMSEIAANALAEQYCSLALVSRSDINLDEPFHRSGVDSLSAVYLRSWIMQQFGVDVAIFDILGDMSIVTIGTAIAKDWRAKHSEQAI